MKTIEVKETPMQATRLSKGDEAMKTIETPIGRQEDQEERVQVWICHHDKYPA